MMRVCHLDTCPVGVATQNPELRKRFTGKPEFVVNFFEFIAEEVRELPRRARLPLDRRGRSATPRCSTPRAAIDHWKAHGLDLTPILAVAENPYDGQDLLPARRRRTTASTARSTSELIAPAAPALERGEPVEIELPIRNVNRTVGTMLGSELTRSATAATACPTTPSTSTSRGSAGQSFGAFVPARHHAAARGRRQRLHRQGPLGRHASSCTPTATRRSSPRRTSSPATSSLYGATGGEVYLRGVVGERFCVRNSGATAVVEGVGDHGCEYMTGGRVVVLGPTGRNFGAGMSGGIAYVYDPDDTFPALVNYEMVELEPLDDDDREWLRATVERHRERDRLGGRRAAARRSGTSEVESFRKVMPQGLPARARRCMARGARQLGLSRGRDARREVMAAAHG